MKFYIRCLQCFLLFLTLVGCGSPTTKQINDPTGNILPTKGSFCNKENVCIHFGAEVVTQKLAVQIQKQEPQNGSIGPVYSIQAEQEVFEKSIQIALPIPKEHQEKALLVAFWKDDQWTTVPSEKNTDGTSMLGTTNHFSRWTLIEDNSQPAECSPGQTQDCGSDVGACQKGKQTCVDGKWQTCQHQIVPSKEVCDGKDNDCDGQTDEDFANIGTVCTIRQNSCSAKGKYICNKNAQSTTCHATITTSQEICDGKDNDCDGQTDEGCDCRSGETKACGSSVGTCTQGQQVCQNGKWSKTCSGNTAPTTEVCDGKDNDCDGQTDEDFANVGTNCLAGIGSCKKSGVYICSTDKKSTLCNARPQRASTEVCDGKDNDCDGQTDEDLTKACTTACGTGTQTCTAGSWSSCVGPQPSSEVCDGKDNDCDGQTDENLTKTCPSGSKQTTSTCSSGLWSSCNTTTS